MTHLKIIQGNNQSDTEEVSMDIINKLYELASSGDLDAASELKGYLHLQVGDRAKIEYLTNMFQNKLFITASNYLIPFEDQNMVTYLNSLGIGSNGVITEADAAAATIVANSANTTVTKFNELKYFTQITQSRGGLSGYDSGYVRFAGWTALEEVDLSNFTSIGHSHRSAWEDTFANCTNLKKVVASDKLTVIGVRAFDDCQNLEEIIGLDGTLTVYEAAFFRNKKLKNSNFANVEILFPISNNGESFSQTESITSLTLSAQNTTIPGYAFYGSKIATLNFPAGLTSIQDSAFKNSDLAVNASVLSNVTSFGDSCFTDTKITGIFAPSNNLTLLDKYSFLGTKISSVDLSSTSLTTLYQGVFADCKNLTSVTLPQSLTTINESVFSGCTSLTSINLSNITSFGNNCLYGCHSLTASDVNWTNVTKIGGSAFSNVYIQQQNLVMPNLTDLGAWPFGNNNSSGIVSVDFTGSTFTWLNGGLFEGHSSIDHVTLPATLSTIGGWGHFNNTSVRWIKFLSTSIIAFENGKDAGYLGIPASTKIYVLDALVDDWKADSKWSSVASQIFPMSQFATDFPNE